MGDKLKLQHQNDKRGFSDLQWLNEFYAFLQGETPAGIRFTRGHKPEMSAKKAFSIIWYLQEHFPVFPANIEICNNCDRLFDYDMGGIYWESKGKFFCGVCDHLVPENYDRGKR